jgi:hypothetical protein
VADSDDTSAGSAPPVFSGCALGPSLDADSSSVTTPSRRSIAHATITAITAKITRGP